jgi:hypothetical protein
MKPRTATVLGFLIAPLVPIVVGGLVIPAPGPFEPVAFFGIGSLMYLYTCILMTLFALPVYLVLNEKRKVSWWAAALAGCFIGALVASVIRLPNYPRLSEYVRWAPEGALAGLVFWLVWRMGAGRTRT